jgi:hypothetical protein
MTKLNEVVESMPFCGGDLLLMRRIRRWSTYDGPTGDHHHDLAVKFRLHNKERRIRSLEDLASITSNLDCIVEKWVSGHEIQFATILAPLINLGRIVSDADLYSFLEEKYGLSVSSHLPRLEETCLRFLSARITLDKGPIVFDVSLDLSSYNLKSRRILLSTKTDEG